LSIGNGEIESGLIDPPKFGINYSPIEKLVGGEASENAKIALAVFAGEKGAPRDATILNSAAAIAAFNYDMELDLTTRFEEGIAAATEAIDSGAAQKLLSRWVELTQAIAKS
jgi:anthranilate phosphoribosyltransferase